METTKTYENYPAAFVLLTNLITFSIYALGVYILAKFGLFTLIVYLIYCLLIELRLLKKSCVDCYYYGKICFSGRGLICSLLFKKGDPKRFLCTEISLKELIPDFLVTIIPLLAGIISLIINFNWLLLIMLLILIILGFPVTGYLRGSLACKFCKQRELGCPAQDFFSKKNEQSK